MKHFHNCRFVFFCMPMLFAFSCSPKAKDTDNKKVADANAAIEKQKGQFDPAFQNNPQSSHFAVKINFENGVFLAVPNSLSKRAGRLPHGNNSGGDFKVEYKDANNKLLGNYFIQDPTTIRSCDEGGKPFVKKINKGSFELLLPADRSISIVEFSTGDTIIGKLSIPLNRFNTDTNGNTNHVDTIK